MCCFFTLQERTTYKMTRTEPHLHAHPIVPPQNLLYLVAHKSLRKLTQRCVCSFTLQERTTYKMTRTPFACTHLSCHHNLLYLVAQSLRKYVFFLCFFFLFFISMKHTRHTSF
ncbi:unnamed protein product [Bodo saltans]|uniref:Transmembrane protein n=1 Tax=Bodo saltans TaxID=75058 RepID=A0A0S4J5V4_BODSA|nr:unnamed protein product [Bodo saltans]|eukprot:CUG85667.1 unnamed protein product [Bodo saltans]